MLQYREIFYKNYEKEAIEEIYEAKEAGIRASVMDPGKFIYSGPALANAIQGARIPCAEVQLTNHYSVLSFQKSLTQPGSLH